MLQLLDLAGLYFRAFHAVPASTRSPDGRPVNAVRGTLDMLARIIAEGRPTRMMACLDLDWRPAWRVRLLPSYKAHRVLGAGAGEAARPRRASSGALGDGLLRAGHDLEVVPDELAPQVPIVLAALRGFGITLAGATGYEADDVLGTLAEVERIDPVEVVTGDRDLFQLARPAQEPRPAVTVRYLGAGMAKMRVLDAAAVASKYGIPAGGYADFAALRGDPSDGLPGVAGIGDKTAAELVRSFGSVENILAAAEDRRSGLGLGVRGKILAAADYLEVAPTVVRVARDAPVELDPDGDGSLPRTPADPAALAELVKAHGIGSPVKRLIEALAQR